MTRRGRLWLRSGLGRGLVAAVVGWLVAGRQGALVAVAVGPMAPLAWSAVVQRRRRRQYDHELVVLLRAIASGLRSGAALRNAIAEVGSGRSDQLRHDLAVLAFDFDRGVSTALARWAERRPRPAVRLVAAGLALGYETGGVTAAVVDGLADSIRVRLDGLQEAESLAVQANLSALVLAGAPVAMLLGGLVGHSSSTAFLTQNMLGRVCLTAGLALDGLALLWMRRIVAKVAS